MAALRASGRARSANAGSSRVYASTSTMRPPQPSSSERAADQVGGDRDRVARQERRIEHAPIVPR